MYCTTPHIAPTVSFLKVLSMLWADPPPHLHHFCQGPQLAGGKVKSSTWIAHTSPRPILSLSMQCNATPPGMG